MKMWREKKKRHIFGVRNIFFFVRPDSREYVARAYSAQVIVIMMEELFVQNITEMGIFVCITHILAG